MIKYVQYNDIDKDKWDHCIKDSFNGNICAYSWYLEGVANEWDALIEDDYERVFPLTYRKKAGIYYLYQPVFTQQLGVFSKSILTKVVTEQFVEKIPSKFKFIEINLNAFNKLDSTKYVSSQYLNHELDLISDHATLYANYSQNTKRNIKKAEKSDISIVKNIKPDEVIRLFRENKGKNIDNLTDYDYLSLKRVVYTCLYKGKAQVYGAYTDHNTLCAGAIFVISHKKAVLLFTATNDTAKQTGAMSLLIDHFIKSHAQSHLTLDFEGSNDPNLARFYKSFNSNEVYYTHLKINRLNPLISKGIQSLKWVKKQLK